MNHATENPIVGAARRRITEVLEKRGPCDQNELMRRLGNISGDVSGPLIRQMVMDRVLVMDGEGKLSFR